MSMDLSEFYEVFFEEAEELLADMEKLLIGLNVDEPDIEELNAVFRAAHSIKGGASTFGMPEITEVTHVLESLLDKIRKSELALTREHVDVFLQAQDVLSSMISARRAGGTADPAAAAAVMETLRELAQSANGAADAVRAQPSSQTGAEVASQVEDAEDIDPEVDAEGEDVEDAMVAEGSAATREERVDQGVAEDASASLKRQSEQLVSAALDDESFGLFDAPAAPVDAAAAVSSGAAAASVAAEPSGNKETGDGSGKTVAKLPSTPVSAAPSSVSPATASASAAAGGTAGSAAPVPAKTGAAKSAAGKDAEKPRTAESSSIRVGIEKVDELINMVGELVITHAMIEQLTTELNPVLHQRMLNSVAQLARNTRELQASVLGIRMLPMEVVFSRFPRMVRDLAAKLGKNIEFITLGASTELDKSLTERLVDPLTHLVRNSIDHGIEMPEVRKAAGKSPTGRLTLSAAHQGGSIIIEVSDDGGGLNRERILAKAKQQGLPVSDNMPDDEVWPLIFAAGFSTADQVTDVSGRGVGMDVVKRNITSMGGTVEIRSARGFGSSMRISLPLTLAILDGMSVRVGDEIYILGLASVIESLQPSSSVVKDIMGQGSVVRVREEYLPIIPLFQIFGITPKFTDPAQGIIVILEAEGKKVGLLVDELVGQQQVVVKSLETNYRRVTGISGATILGDGSVALILDVPNLIRQSRQTGVDSAITQWEQSNAN